MRLYSLQNRHILLVFVAFFASFLLSLNIGVFGPNMLNSIQVSAANMSRSINLKTGPFVLETPFLNRFHQQLWITAQPIIKGRKEEFSKEITINIHLHSDSSSSMESSGKKKDQLHSEYHNRSRMIHCINEKCQAFNVLHLDYLHSEQYVIDLRLFNIEETVAFEMQNILFIFNSYNPSFTKLELWYRFFFLTVSFVVLMLYTNSLKKFSLRDWSIEQKWVFILLRSLLFFNNPLFPLIVLVDSWLPRALDAMFQSTFLGMIMVFWLSIYHGVRHSDRNFLTFYVPKFVIVFAVWLLSIFLLLWQQFKSFSDPSYDLTLDESNYYVFRILFVIFAGLYFLFLLYLIVRAVTELKNMPYYDIRIKFTTALMIVVISTLTLIAVLRVKSDPFRQNLFENFTKNYRNSVEFCAIFSLFNVYIYTLAFVYSPAKNAHHDNDLEYGSNPTFSMLADENTDEEDLVYGMETFKASK